VSVSTVTTTSSVAVQPLVASVTVNVYVVVADGFAVGFAAVPLLREPELFQEYVFALEPEAPIPAPLVLDTQVFVNVLPALAEGTCVSTVTTTSSVAVQPLEDFVVVTVYVVVELGFAVGFAAVAVLNPVEGDQEYVTPLTALAPIVEPFALEVQVLVKLLPALVVAVEIS
jgi:hypothetical protein